MLVVILFYIFKISSKCKQFYIFTENLFLPLDCLLCSLKTSIWDTVFCILICKSSFSVYHVHWNNFPRFFFFFFFFLSVLRGMIFLLHRHLKKQNCSYYVMNVLKCTLKIHYSRKRGRGEVGKGDTECRQALEWGFPTTVKNLLKEKGLLASELLLAGFWEVVKSQRRQRWLVP